MISIWSRFRFARNASWRRSASLGLRLGFWWAPSSLFEGIAYPLFAIVTATGLFIFMVIAGVAMHLAIILAGLMGYVSEPVAPPETVSKD